MPRAQIEVDWEGDDEAGRAVIEGALDGLIGNLVDDEAIVDPGVTVTWAMPEAVEWQL